MKDAVAHAGPIAAVCLGLLLAVSGTARAQSSDKVLGGTGLAPTVMGSGAAGGVTIALEPMNGPLGEGRTAPAVGFVAPSAFGLHSGVLVLGGAYTDRTRVGGISSSPKIRGPYQSSNSEDGVLALVGGIGNPSNFAVEAGVTFLSLGKREPFGERGSVSVKVHRLIGPSTAVAVGVASGMIWGGSDLPSKAYAVVSHLVGVKAQGGEIRKSLYLSGGVAYAYANSSHDPYRSEALYEIEKYGRLQALVGAGLRISEPFTVFAEWSGEDVNVGCSVMPFKSFPVVITPAIGDLGRRSANSPRFMLAVSLPLFK